MVEHAINVERAVMEREGIGSQRKNSSGNLGSLGKCYRGPISEELLSLRCSSRKKGPYA